MLDRITFVALSNNYRDCQLAGGVVLWDFVHYAHKSERLMDQLLDDPQTLPLHNRADHVFGRHCLVVPLHKDVDELQLNWSVLSFEQ